MEVTSYQLLHMKSDMGISSDVNPVRGRPQNASRNVKNDDEPMQYAYFCCGRVGHAVKLCHQKDKTCYKWWSSRILQNFITQRCKSTLDFSDKSSNNTMTQVNNVGFVPNNIDCIFALDGDEQVTDQVFIDGNSVDVIIDSDAGVKVFAWKEFKAHNFKPCHCEICTNGLKKAMEICGYFFAQVSGRKMETC